MLINDIVYCATVTSSNTVETYVGLTVTSFKSRYTNHKASFKIESKRNATELGKHVWDLKDDNLEWSTLCCAPHYSSTRNDVNLCITEKLLNFCKPENATLNKQNDLVSKCRHKEKFLPSNVARVRYQFPFINLS